jgi:hypothetical protein
MPRCCRLGVVVLVLCCLELLPLVDGDCTPIERMWPQPLAVFALLAGNVDPSHANPNHTPTQAKHWWICTNQPMGLLGSSHTTGTHLSTVASGMVSSVPMAR